MLVSGVWQRDSGMRIQINSFPDFPHESDYGILNRVAVLYNRPLLIICLYIVVCLCQPQVPD